MTFDKYPHYESVTWKRRQASASLEDLENRLENAFFPTREITPMEHALTTRLSALPCILEYVVSTIRAVGHVNAGVAETTGETALDTTRVREIREELHNAAVHTHKAVRHLLDGLGYILGEEFPHMMKRAKDSHEEALDSLDAARESVRGAHVMWKALYAGLPSDR